MTHLTITRFAAGAFFSIGAALISASAMAAATLTTVRGEVRAAVDETRHGPAAQNDRIESGWTVRTGPKSQAVLRFDDGQQVLLNENTEFKITEFRFAEAKPENDRAIFQMIRGALRVITGKIGQRNQNAFALRTPQMTIGIRGTEFMVALVNPAYFSVTSGVITTANAAGTASFAAGAVGTVANAATLATAIGASALPASVASAFSSMSSVTLGAAGATTVGGAGGAAGGAAGAAGTAAAATVPAGAIAAGAVAAGAAAAGGGGGGNTTTTHH